MLCLLNSRIPLVRTSSKLAVNCGKTPEGQPRPNSRPAPGPQGSVKDPRSPLASLDLEHGPYHPALRANPFPEVTDLLCRLPLPTLFYQLEAVHLGDLLRLCVRPGEKIIVSIVFSRTVGSAPDPA